MSKTRKKALTKKIVKLDSLKQINLNAAGLDIGAAEIWACVPRRPHRDARAGVPDLHH